MVMQKKFSLLTGMVIGFVAVRSADS